MGDIAGVNYTMLDGIEEMMLKPTVGGPEQLMRVRRARVRTPDASVLLVGVAQWPEGRVDVRTLEVVRGASEYEQLVSKYRIGVYPLDERTSYMEITDLQPDANGELAAVRVEMAQLEKLAGGPEELSRVCKLEQIKIMTKADIPGVGKSRHSFLAAQFPSGRQSAAVAAYILARVIPVCLTVESRSPWPARDRQTSAPVTPNRSAAANSSTRTITQVADTPRTSIPNETLETTPDSHAAVRPSFSGGRRPLRSRRRSSNSRGKSLTSRLRRWPGRVKRARCACLPNRCPNRRANTSRLTGRSFKRRRRRSQQAWTAVRLTDWR